ncbi:conserved protein of unknown function [Limnospira indica PCC 8005]|uniref:Uncharacterized protein n=1 Tax=Limnospira indica PCC 8005 TaxID=376219 RepID=A0A9P1KCE1_9CYAN|nr:conserved protein of unknown function [Limnospira indica PCC 8005]
MVIPMALHRHLEILKIVYGIATSIFSIGRGGFVLYWYLWIDY